MTPENKAIDVGARKQLFIDAALIARQEGIALAMNPPRKADMVLLPETPIESQCVSQSRIVRMPDEWWMYYTAIPLGNFDYDPAKKDGSGYMICLATSADGLTWKRKNVNLFTIQGSRNNNVVMPQVYGDILCDPNRSDGHPYWFLANLKETSVWKEGDGLQFHSGLYLLKSKDGIHWVRHPGQALPFYMDSNNECFYDGRLRKYVAYLRSWVPGKNRCVSRLEFDDLLKLPWPHAPFDPQRKRLMVNTLIDEIPVVMTAEPGDPPGMDLYTACVLPYAEADNVYLAFPSRYRHYDGYNSHGRDLRGRYENDGVLDVALAVSRDGIHWTRFPQAYVGLGILGQRDDANLYMGTGMIRHGDEIWQYCATPSRRAYLRQEGGAGGIMRLVQRVDGFVSADAGPEGGELVTPLLRFAGSRLRLNIDCGAMGEAWVEIQDDHDRPIPGFTLAESVSVDRNGLAQEVWWTGGPDVASLAGKPVRLWIKMRGAKLYAFQFGKAE
ncbi:MAG: hypothetical protein HYV36_08365 [Lentisphaerae bacterium]|nr:hypothetical protein [Lentisphaerota bacterium]